MHLIERVLLGTISIRLLISMAHRWRSQNNFFLPHNAAAKIQTRFSRVAPTSDLLKDALPTELPRCCFLSRVVYWCPVSNRTFFLEVANSIRGSQVLVVCCGSPNFSSNEVRSIKRPQKTERLKSRIILG